MPAGLSRTYQPKDEEGERLPPESTLVQVKAEAVLRDTAAAWAQDPSTDAWKTEPVRTLRTKKVPRNHVGAEATEKHPAQVEVYYEDVPIGYWTTVKLSGALPARRVRELTERVEKLQQAVKCAREEADAAEVPGSTGPGPSDVEMPVRIWPAELDLRWSKGRTRRHHD